MKIHYKLYESETENFPFIRFLKKSNETNYNQFITKNIKREN